MVRQVTIVAIIVILLIAQLVHDARRQREREEGWRKVDERIERINSELRQRLYAPFSGDSKQP
jgi:hypothetical protein